MKIVVKIGGSLLKEGVPMALIEDLRALAPAHQIVIVHGGGDIVSEYSSRLGREQRFVVSPGGIRSRYTDRETAEMYQMVMSGLLAKRLVSALARAGLKAVSLSGTDARLLQGQRKSKLVIMDGRGRKVAIEGGYTGRVVGVNAALLDYFLSHDHMPVVSPVASGEEAEALNVDGDRAASSIAAGIKAEIVVFLTDVDGLKLDGVLVPHLTASEASSKLPMIGFGMQKKVIGAVDAVKAGVREAIISSGTRAEPLSAALSHDTCTVISDQ